MATQNDELPTMPSSEAPPVDANTVVWLVSYDENDDRELTRPQIAAALTRGEIDGNTIVWREGLEEWLPIADVPELVPLLPASGETKDVGEVAPLGFLGTGLQLKTDTQERKSVPPPLPRKSEPPKATTAAEPPIANTAVEAAKPAAPEEPSRKSIPPPLPAARATKQGGDEDAPMSVDPESLGPESFAEAVMSGEAMPKARALSSGTFGVAGGGHLTDAAPSSRPPESDPPPSSGTPSLMSLAATHGEEAPKIDDEILALGGTAAPGLMPPPNIDVSDIEQTAKNSLTPPTAAASEPPPPASASARPQSTTTASSRAASAAPKAARPPVLPWIITAAAVVGAVYAFARRPAPPPETLPVPAAPTPVAAQPQATPVATEPAAPSPAVPSAEPASSVVATAAPMPSSTPAAASSSKGALATPTTASGAKPKATAAPSATATPSAAATPSSAPSASAPTAASGAPPAASTPSETEPATPFDKDAANAALQSTAAEAASCRKEGDPSGRAVVHVTFANTGRAIRATVEGPPFAGTATGGCIAQVMRKAQVPPFSGDKVTVAKTVNVD